MTSKIHSNAKDFISTYPRAENIGRGNNVDIGRQARCYDIGCTILLKHKLNEPKLNKNHFDGKNKDLNTPAN